MNIEAQGRPAGGEVRLKFFERSKMTIWRIIKMVAGQAREGVKLQLGEGGAKLAHP